MGGGGVGSDKKDLGSREGEGSQDYLLVCNHWDKWAGVL